ncbi:MAG: hypothetical protein M3Y58_19695 [Chloroflexota bacterium]|nr:hypothetical protein [Chloroflexota bacterium]
MMQTTPQERRQPQRRVSTSAYDGILDALPPKIRNALLGAGITSLAQADALADAALMRIQWIGPETVRYLRALARHLPIDHGPMQARDAEELRRHAGMIAGEIARGRLSPDLTARTIHGPMMIGALIERWGEPAHCSIEDLNLARALMHALRYGTLDAEFRALFAGLTDPQRAMVRYRYDPVAPLTFADAASRIGRSPERTRTIAIEARDALLDLFGAHHFPRTRTAIHLTAARIAAGDSLRAVADDLAACGLLHYHRHFDDLLILWRATDLERPFPTEEHIVAAREGLTEGQRTLRAAIRPRADALSRNCGALTPAWLDDDADDAEIRAVLPSLGYTAIAPDWFWCDRASHTGVESVMRKVFMVAERVTPRELRAALAKHHGRRQFPTPPTEIVRAVALRLGLATPDGDCLKRARQFDGEGVLSDAEEALIAFFRAHDPVVTFGELFEESRAANDVPRGLDRLLSRSPIIRRVRQGLYTLVGTPLTRQEIADAADRIQSAQSGGELRYNVDGTATYEAPASAWLLYSGILNAAELRPFEGTWQTVSGARVTIRGQTAWGLGKAIRALDLAVGERIAIRLDTWERTITVERCDR